MNTQCIICDNAETRAYIPGLKRCGKCGLVFFDTDLSDGEMRNIYSVNYFFGINYADYVREKKALQLNFKRCLNELLNYVESPKEKNLFEIGSAYGFFLESARPAFASVRGIDVSPDGCSYAKEKLGLDVICDNFLNVDIEKDRYDVFCLWDTIEHLRQPHLYIEKIGHSIRTGGIVSLTTGDIGSLNALVRKGRWRMIHPPEHLFYFSEDTISAILSKYGFEILKITHPGNYRTLNGMFIRRQNSIFYRLLKDRGLLDIPVYFNLFDIMQVMARKK